MLNTDIINNINLQPYHYSNFNWVLLFNTQFNNIYLRKYPLTLFGVWDLLQLDDKYPSHKTLKKIISAFFLI